MNEIAKHVVLICEDGWEGIREFAIKLSAKGIPVSVIIKGDPGPEVREIITSLPKIKNYFFKRNPYRLFLFPLLIGLYLREGWNVCCITKKRTYRHLQKLQSLLKFRLYFFEESGKNSQCVSTTGEKVSYIDLASQFILY